MASTTVAKNALVKASIEKEHYELASQTVWTRLRKFKSGNVIYRDFESTNGLFVARVQEINSKITLVFFLEPEQLIDAHIKETSRLGRPWVDNGTDINNLNTSEFAFGIANHQQTNKLQLLITPASYFIKNGELWPEDIKTKLIPKWLDKITNGIFQSNTANIKELKKRLLDLGFIETDQLSDYHKEMINKNNYNTNNDISI